MSSLTWFLIDFWPVLGPKMGAQRVPKAIKNGWKIKWKKWWTQKAVKMAYKKSWGAAGAPNKPQGEGVGGEVNLSRRDLRGWFWK